MFNSMLEESIHDSEPKINHISISMCKPPKDPSPPSGGRNITMFDNTYHSISISGPTNDPAPPSGGRTLGTLTIPWNHCVISWIPAASHRELLPPPSSYLSTSSAYRYSGGRSHSKPQPAPNPKPKPPPAPPSGGRSLSVLLLDAMKLCQKSCIPY